MVETSVSIFRNFLNSNWCMQEFYFAHRLVTEGNVDFLIPILLEDMPIAELPRDLQAYLRTFTYIDARKNDTDTLRKRIRFAMPDVPLKKLKGNQPNQTNDDDNLLEGIELENDEENNEQRHRENIVQEVIQADAIGGILRLLQADGTILEVQYPARLQCESEESSDSDNVTDRDIASINSNDDNYSLSDDA